MNQPLVHVLVINWNGREHLAECFESLLASSCNNVEFVLVDNGSEDDSTSFVRSRFGHDSRVAILPCGNNLGWSGGNNAGIRRAQECGAKYVFLLNNDTAIAPDCVEQLITSMEAQPSCGALAPKMLFFDYPNVLNSMGLEMSIIGAAWDRGIGETDTPAWNDPTPAIGVSGGACFLRTSVLEETGLLPEEFEIYLDDLDLCLRIWRAGYNISTCPAAAVRHKFSATMGEGFRARRKYYLNTRNRFWLLARHYPVSRLVAVFPAVIGGEMRALGRATIDRSFWRIWAHLRAWAAFFSYLPRARRFYNQHGSTNSFFWHMLKRTPLFCPPVRWPEEGRQESLSPEG
jgi:GT2 family glycosyltransferase